MENNTMTKILTFMTFMAIAMMPLHSFAMDKKPMESKVMEAKPALYALAFHSDKCASCKVLGPNVKEAKNSDSLKETSVKFVKFDLTDKQTKKEAAVMAETLGVTDVYKKHAKKTGFLLVVNSNTGEVLEKITKKHDADQITAAILKQSSML